MVGAVILSVDFLCIIVDLGQVQDFLLHFQGHFHMLCAHLWGLHLGGGLNF